MPSPLRFESNQAKSASNLMKHLVAFRFATRVPLDPHRHWITSARRATCA
jgi:hypothetical protein